MGSNRIMQENMLSDELKAKFEIPVNSEDEAGYSFAEKSDMQTMLNTKCLSLLEKALVHVRKYDSKETAIKLVLIAYRKIPSFFVKKHILLAHKALKAAVKAEKWLTIKRKKKYVSEASVRKNLDHFYEYIAEAVAAIRIDLDKKNLSLFSKIKKQYQSDLPLVLPVDKKFTAKRAHIVAMCQSAPNSKHPVKRLESNFFLIEDVPVIGINRNIFKPTLKKAKELAALKGKVVYEQVISRPSNNIDWYMVLDFGTDVTYASFADSLEVIDSTDGQNPSYEGYLRKVMEERRTARKLKTERLRDLRLTFMEENKTLYEDIRTAEIKIENLEVLKQSIAEEFTSITAVGTLPGLDIGQIKRLYERSLAYRNQINFEGVPLELLNKMMVQFRVDAKSMWYEYKDVAQEALGFKHHKKYLEAEIANRKQNYLQKAGMVSLTKYISSELD